MVSGSTVYRKIKSNISLMESKLEKINKKIEKCEDSITESMNERENCYGQLAAFYLPELDAVSLRTTLAEVQNEVKRIFEQKQKRRKELDGILSASKDKRKDFEAKLDEVTGKLNVKVKEKEKLSKVVGAELEKNSDYKEFRLQAGKTSKQLADFRKRVKKIEKDAEDKLPAYESDKLFKYLLDRNFGDAEYKGKGIIAKLDAGVAKVVNYKEAKQSYDFLQLVPEIMKEEVGKKEKDLEKIVRKMKGIEDESSERNGLAKIIKEGIVIGRNRENLLRAIEEVDSEYSACQKERQDSENTKGSYYAEAIGKLKDYLLGSTIADLKKKALRTKDRTDDNLVEQIEKIDSNISNMKKIAKELRSIGNKFEEKLGGLKSIGNKFANSDYESGSSYFESGFDINALLLGYLAGKYSERSLWNKIENNQDFERSSSYSNSSSYSSSSSSDSFGSFSSGGGFGGGGGFSSGAGF